MNLPDITVLTHVGVLSWALVAFILFPSIQGKYTLDDT